MEKGDSYKIFLIVIFLGVWIWAAINPKYPDTWFLENLLVFAFIPLLFIMGYFFKLSNISYTLITIFMILHVIGSHYTYGETPLGYILQEIFHSPRNMYDRVVHFSFGLLFYYPIREILIRLGKLKGTWALYFPIDIVLAFSAVYELIEWFVMESISSGAGQAFLGSQADIWDAQKDILNAFVGSIAAMIVVFVVNHSFNKKFWGEIKESMKLQKGDKPLGEFKILQWFKEKEEKFIKKKRGYF